MCDRCETCKGADCPRIPTFPLPENAAVNDFLMTIGDRTIRGVIREKEEAAKIYSEARRQGHAASLLTQERPNIFTQHVANIESGKQIDVEVRYFHTLAYRDGWFEWVFPMVVGPRFNPPDQKTTNCENCSSRAMGRPATRFTSATICILSASRADGELTM